MYTVFAVACGLVALGFAIACGAKWHKDRSDGVFFAVMAVGFLGVSILITNAMAAAGTLPEPGKNYNILSTGTAPYHTAAQVPIGDGSYAALITRPDGEVVCYHPTERLPENTGFLYTPNGHMSYTPVR